MNLNKIVENAFKMEPNSTVLIDGILYKAVPVEKAKYIYEVSRDTPYDINMRIHLAAIVSDERVFSFISTYWYKGKLPSYVEDFDVACKERFDRVRNKMKPAENMELFRMDVSKYDEERIILEARKVLFGAKKFSPESAHFLTNQDFADELCGAKDLDAFAWYFAAKTEQLIESKEVLSKQERLLIEALNYAEETEAKSLAVLFKNGEQKADGRLFFSKLDTRRRFIAENSAFDLSEYLLFQYGYGLKQALGLDRRSPVNCTYIENITVGKKQFTL